MAPIQFQIWTLGRWTLSDFLPIKPVTISKSFQFTETKCFGLTVYKHVKIICVKVRHNMWYIAVFIDHSVVYHTIRHDIRG